MKHWAQMQENTFLGGITLLLWVHRLTGRTGFRLCAFPAVLWYWAVNPQARRASREFLERAARARGSPVPARTATLRHQFSFAENLLDKLLAVSGRYPLAQLAIEGADAVRGRLRRGEGVLLVTAHVGCLELCQANVDSADGPRLTILVHTHHAEQFNALLKQLRPASRIQLLQVSDITPATAVLLNERIRAGEMVAMAGDRVPLAPSAANTVWIDFLGHAAPFPVGPYVLAMLLKCPLYYMSCVRRSDGHRIRFLPLAESVSLPRGNRNQAIASYARQFAQMLEQEAMESPFEWFNFHSIWNAAPQPAMTEHDR
jgi:predicted LPLAT superfamily acyltransferase